MNNDKIISFLKDNPGATAQEIGVTPVEMTRLAAKGIVEKVGNRKTGTRGRPPVEWALPGAEVPEREQTVSASIPVLKRMSDEIRAGLTDEQKRKVKYIEGNFDGLRGVRQVADFNLLRSVYQKIAKEAARRVNAPLPVFDDEIIEDDES